jgi:hypothetical protein
MSRVPEPCVVSRLHGGLGNQMFEYAAGYALARRLGVPHRVDSRIFERQADRTFELRPFDLALDEATEEMIRALTPQWGRWYKNKWILWSQRLTPFHRRRWVKEQTFDFDERLFRVRPPVYLDGWWQSEKYFGPSAGEIRRMFRYREPPSARSAGLGAEIASQPSVAVHVRRGDYVDWPDAAQFHGCCSPGYYAAAARWIRAELPGAPFWVFSDDPAWAKENLKLEGDVRWVDAAPAHSTHEDFYLMGCCTHFIIANSSFSWWPAWLRDGPGQLVAAPRRWFLGFDVNPSDRFPADWRLFEG